MVIITLSGTPGSGKSTIGQLLKKKLNIDYVYSGEIFRDKAKKYNMSLEEFGRYCEKNDNIDRELDERQLEILKNGDVILEGRLAGWIAEKNNIKAFKIMINADLDTRIKRVLKRENGIYKKRKDELLKREKSEEARYKKYYDIDLKDNSIYDLIIDSTDKSPNEILDLIMKRINL